MYLNYAQTPELRELDQPTERDAVHREAWQRLRAEHPAVFVRSIAIVFCTVLVGGYAGNLLAEQLFQAQLSSGSVIGAAIGGAIGALLHIHLTAISLRPIYREIITRRHPA